MRKITFFSFILFCLTCVGFGFAKGQQKIDSAKSKEFWKLNQAQSFNIKKGFEYGKKMVQYAQNDYEKSVANSVLAENRYMLGDYVSAVSYLEKAREHAWKTDSLEQKVRVLNYLIVSYRRAGLPYESDENFKVLQSLSKNLPAESRDAIISYAQCKMYDIDEDYCKSAAIRKKYLGFYSKDDQRSDFDKRFQYTLLCQSAYVQLKCGDLTATYQIFKQLEDLKPKIKDKSNISFTEFYLLTQGMIAARSNDKEKSKKLFDSAMALSDYFGGKTVQKLILTERLETDIDSPSDQLKYAKIIRGIMNSETRVTKDLTKVESLKVREILGEKEQEQKLFVLLGVAIFLILLAVAYYFFNRNKKLKRKYLEIIRDIEREKQNSTSLETLPEVGKGIVEEKNNALESSELEGKKESLMSDATEMEILHNLEIFERKKLFITSGISTAQMAVLVKTNTKYLSHILKKYRNSDFNQYINQKRIDYIVGELHDNPQARNYKIAVLAEMSGYNSHSQFASIFKTIKGISPSKFIQFLSEK